MDTNYDEWSDGEITWRVHHVFNKVPKGYATICVADFCNKFEDWYPIAEKYGMSLDVGGGASIPKSVSGLDNIISYTCEGKLGRAVSICFLKLTDATHD